MDLKQAEVLLWWRFQPLIGLLLGIVIVAIFGTLSLLLQFSRPPPGQGINVPRQWTCQSNRGGYCVRTGGFDRQGRPWGTAVAKWYGGPPTKEDAARMAMTSGR